jgi:hypothetical protein
MLGQGFMRAKTRTEDRKYINLNIPELAPDPAPFFPCVFKSSIRFGVCLEDDGCG